LVAVIKTLPENPLEAERISVPPAPDFVRPFVLELAMLVAQVVVPVTLLSKKTLIAEVLLTIRPDTSIPKPWVVYCIVPPANVTLPPPARAVALFSDRTPAEMVVTPE
jgi:hypothetical protein